MYFLFTFYSLLLVVTASMAKKKQQSKVNKAPAVAAVKETTTVQKSVAPSAAPVKWMMIALAAVVFLVNFHTLSFDYTLDDPFFTKENPNVSKGLSAIREFFTHAAYYGVFKHHDASYRPLMLTSFALEKDLFDFNPHTSHLINLILFALESVVLFQLLRKMFVTASVWIPYAMTLLFVLHPMHTEVVASVKSRDEIMGLLFAALALIQTLQYADTGQSKYLIFSAAWFFCALMSKETPIAFVLIAPMTLWFFRSVDMKKILTAVAPYAVVVVLYLLMRSAFIESDGEKVRILVNNNGLMAATTYGEKLATALWIQLKYLIILGFPHPLSYDYSYSQIPIISFASPKALAAVGVIIALFVYALKGFKKKDVFAWCILYYGMSVIITANVLVDIGATMAERFIFSGSLGFCVALVWLLAKLLKADTGKADFSNTKPLFATVTLVCVLYAGKTIARNEVWQSNETLYESGLETAPDSWRAQYLYGADCTTRLSKETDVALKKELYEKAAAAFSRSLEILPNNSDVYLMQGFAHEFAGMLDSAIVAYTNTLRLDSGNIQAGVNLGSAYLRTGRLDDAIQILSRVLARDPDNPDALTNIGAAHGNKGLFRESIGYYERAVSIKPQQQPNVYMSMSNVYRYLGDSANTQKYRALMNRAIAEGGVKR